MALRNYQFYLTCLVAALSYPAVVGGQDLVGTGFEVCKIRLGSILNGSNTWRGISNETIAQYQYFGPVRGMNPEYERMSRNRFITLTTQG